MPATFELQGHRGARGLKPENTLPGFETALDLGVTSIETDVLLTRDGVPVLIHDAKITPRLCRRLRGSTSPDPASEPLVSSLTLAELRGYRANRNPDRKRFPEQDAAVTPLARQVARRLGIDPYTPPTLSDLFALADKCERAGQVIFDLELKRVPYYPAVIGDEFDGMTPGLLEWRVEATLAAPGTRHRVRVRSFDHRAVRMLKSLNTDLTAAILVAETAPVDPAALAEAAGADTYCPDYRFLDAAQVRACHAAGVRVLPWTVNEESDWRRLIDWGVDGITTDYPDRLAKLLQSRGIEY
jgi:glycerophosphoryl diester phosphodiesterase